MTARPKARARTRLVVFWILTVLWMVAIFCFSSATGPQSQRESGRLAHLLMGWLSPDWQTLPADAQVALFERYDYFVRKCAHVLEYLLLGVSCTLAVRQSFALARRRQGARDLLAPTLASTAICIAYAATDELHQLFVSGRAGMVQDVGIDTLGTVLGISLATLGLWLLRRRAS